MGVPTAETGRVAVKLVIRQIESSGQRDPETGNLQAEMKVRGSTAPVNNGEVA